MAVPHSLDIKAMLAQVATEFLLPKHNTSITKYTPGQLHKLWNPELTGATEQLIPTYLGMINVTFGGKIDDERIDVELSSDPLRKYINLHDCAKALVDILDALKIHKCVFGGNSWGAMLASVLPAYYPGRLLGSMVINGTASLPTTPESIMMTLRTETLMLNEKVPEWWVAVARSAFAGDTAEATNPEFLAYCGVVSQEDPKSIAWALRGILLGRTDTHRLPNTIKDVPVLVIAGAEDRQFPVAMCKSMADAIPASKFVVAPGLAHLASRENPVVLNDMIGKWLHEIGAGGR